MTLFNEFHIWNAYRKYRRAVRDKERAAKQRLQRIVDENCMSDEVVGYRVRRKAGKLGWQRRKMA